MKQPVERRNRTKGFSLVTVLLLVALLTIVLVAFGALLNISLTSSENAELRAQARQNAIAAMGQALGELQKNMGPDQRVSAPASILDSTGTDNTNIIQRIKQPNWTGAWLTTRETTVSGTTPAIDISGSSSQVIPSDYYDSGPNGFKAKHFLRWLVSAPLNNNQTLDGGAPPVTITDPYLPQTMSTSSFSDSNSVILVGIGSTGTLTVSATAGSSGTNPIEVRAWKMKGDMYYRGQRIDQNTYNGLSETEKNLVQSGNFAWWVGDEGVKAKINLVNKNLIITGTETTIDLRTNLASAPTNNIQAVTAYQAVTVSATDPQKMVTFNTIPLIYTNITSNAILSNFHDFTVYSRGVLADVKSGGLKKDLTLLLESGSLPADYVYSATNTGNVYTYTPPNVPSDCLRTEGPNWGLIYRYYNLYKKLELDSDGVFALNTDVYNYSLFSPSIYNGQALDTTSVAKYKLAPSNYRDYILPVPARFQQIFTMFADYPNYWDTVNNTSSPTVGFPPHANPNYVGKVYYMGVYPAVVLWNPYNVRIRSNTANNGQFSSTGILSRYWFVPPMPISISFDGSNDHPIGDIFWVYANILYNLGTGYGNNGKPAPYTLEPGALTILGPQPRKVGDRRYYGNAHFPPLPFGGASVPSPGDPLRSTTLQTGWKASYPYHSYQLGTVGVGGSGTNDPGNSISPYIPVSSNPTLGNITIKSLTNKVTNAGLVEQLMGENYLVVGTQEFNTNSATLPVDATIYKTYSGLPSVTASSLNTLENGAGTKPTYLFVYSYDKKIYPDDTTIRSRMALFSDPLSPTYMLANPDAASAQMAPFELNLDKLDADGNVVDGPRAGTPAIKAELDSNGSNNTISYFGSGAGRVYNLIYKEIPTLPLVSLPQLQHVALGRDYSNSLYQILDGQQPGVGSMSGGGYGTSSPGPTPSAATFNWVVGNGYAHPMIPATAINDGGRSFDHCFYANNALFDTYYFSTIAAQPKSIAAYKNNSKDLSLQDVLDNFLNNSKILANNRLLSWLSDKETNTVVENDLLAGSANTIAPQAYQRASSYAMIDGAFNINSTSVDAWTTVLAGTMQRSVSYMPPSSPTPVQLTADSNQNYTYAPFKYFGVGLKSDTTGNNSGMAAFMRFLLPNNVAINTNNNVYWNGYRQLSLSQIRLVAQQLVKQIKMRGPFLSLAEFVNRQVSGNTNLNQNGPLQAALDAVGVNDDFNNNDIISSSDLGSATYNNPAAAQGARRTGFPGYLTQADVLTPIANSLSARSDTFVVRAYGEVNKNGKVLSRAWCEAVVQRTPEYVEPKSSQDTTGTGDFRYTQISALTSKLNQQFGRRFKVMQFRWLSQDEI
jgi:Tfp pilus assembly protein PilV